MRKWGNNEQEKGDYNCTLSCIVQLYNSLSNEKKPKQKKNQEPVATVQEKANKILKKNVGNRRGKAKGEKGKRSLSNSFQVLHTRWLIQL